MTFNVIEVNEVRKSRGIVKVVVVLPTANPFEKVVYAPQEPVDVEADSLSPCLVIILIIHELHCVIPLLQFTHI